MPLDQTSPAAAPADRAPPAGRAPGLSLVLATLGRSSEIARFLASLGDSRQLPMEVILVDQNADDRLVGIVQEGIAAGLAIRHLRIAPRKGLSLARNAGLSVARYAIVGFPDDDCWYEEGVCRGVIECFERNAGLDGLVGRWLDRHDAHAQPMALDPLEQRKFAGIPIASICLFLRTEAVIRLGGFDESLGVGTWAASSEETDLIFRFLAARCRLEFQPAIQVRHHWPGTAIPVTGNFPAVLRGAMARARGTGAMYARHDLAAPVVLRGLAAPFAKMLGLNGGLRGFAYWLGTGIGRWQGFLRWQGLPASTPRQPTQRGTLIHEDEQAY